MCVRARDWYSWTGEDRASACRAYDLGEEMAFRGVGLVVGDDLRPVLGADVEERCGSDSFVQGNPSDRIGVHVVRNPLSNSAAKLIGSPPIECGAWSVRSGPWPANWNALLTT